VNGIVKRCKQLVHTLAIPNAWMGQRVQEQNIRELQLDIRVTKITYIRKAERKMGACYQ
jgi:hypothetical protein